MQSTRFDMTVDVDLDSISHCDLAMMIAGYWHEFSVIAEENELPNIEAEFVRLSGYNPGEVGVLVIGVLDIVICTHPEGEWKRTVEAFASAMKQEFPQGSVRLCFSECAFRFFGEIAHEIEEVNQVAYSGS